MGEKQILDALGTLFEMHEALLDELRAART
jgi:hypothetical protein